MNKVITEDPLGHQYQTSRVIKGYNCKHENLVKFTPGFHIIADLRDCKCEIETLINAEFVQSYLEDSIIRNGLTVENSFVKSFGDKCGYTCMITLSESHVSLHTYPENMSLHFDIMVCFYKNDNTQKALGVLNDVKSLFKSQDFVISKINRT